MSKKIYVWEYVAPVSMNWHNGGGVLIVCDEGEYEAAWAGYVTDYNSKDGGNTLEANALDGEQPDHVFDTSETEDRVLTFPDAGCC